MAVNHHKRRAALLRDVKLDLCAQGNHHRGPNRTSKDCLDEEGARRDENASEDNSALQYGNSRMHGIVTTKHHLDRVKTSDVAMATGSFVCVCVKGDHSAVL